MLLSNPWEARLFLNGGEMDGEGGIWESRKVNRRRGGSKDTRKPFLVRAGMSRTPTRTTVTQCYVRLLANVKLHKRALKAKILVHESEVLSVPENKYNYR